MGQGRRVALRIAEGLGRRHPDVIGLDRIVGPVAAVADVGAGGGEEGVGLLESRDRTRRLLGAGIIVGGEALDLLAVEDGVALEIGDLALALFAVLVGFGCREAVGVRSEEHTSEIQSLMRISYAVFCLKKKIT